MAQINTSTPVAEVFAGLDWGGSFHQICLLDEHGRVLCQQRVQHDIAGFAELDRLLNSCPGRLRLAIERAEGLLVEYLHTLGVETFCVSPKISARARERYRLAATKSDAFDAFVLADTLRHEHAHWRALSPPSPQLAELRAISRDRDRVVIAQQATENRLRAVLDAYHPAPLHLFSTLDRDITLDFLADYPTPEHAARVGAVSAWTASAGGTALRRRPCPRPGQVPSPARPGQPMDPDPLALLDRPHPLRPRHPPPNSRTSGLTPTDTTPA